MKNSFNTAATGVCSKFQFRFYVVDFRVIIACNMNEATTHLPLLFLNLFIEQALYIFFSTA